MKTNKAYSSPQKTLQLPSTYRSTMRWSGNLRDGRWIDAVELHSGTGGHETVYAQRIVGMDWVEISKVEFAQLLRNAADNL